MNLVLDASMALAWAFERKDPIEHDCAGRALAALSKGDGLVPALWHAEVLNGLLVGERRQVITSIEVGDFLARLDLLSIVQDSALPALRRQAIASLARQYRLTAYDACYLDLVLRSGLTLATFDVALATATQAAGGAVFH